MIVDTASVVGVSNVFKHHVAKRCGILQTYTPATVREHVGKGLYIVPYRLWIILGKMDPLWH